MAPILIPTFHVMGYTAYFKYTFTHIHRFLNITVIGFTNDFVHDLKLRSNKIPEKLVL
jgi:hypothetical protein